MNKFYHIFLLLVIFLGSTVDTQAQEDYCVTGCNDNTFLNSGDPNTMEYDNIVGLYHSTMLQETNDNLLVWGASASATGGNQLSPNAVNPANGYNYGGKILKFTGGSANGTNAQFTILTQDGLYFWGTQGILVRTNVKSGASFGKGNALGTEGETGTSPYSLPMGVSPEDVKMMYGTFNTLVIVTCTGEAWVLSQNRYLYGDGITNTSSSYQYVWHRVSTASNTPLENVVAVRGTTTALMALTSDGEIYTWGQSIYRGNGNSPVSTQTYAIAMDKPSGSIKQIGMTGGNSYYVLNAAGELYSLGKNTSRELGDFTTSERRNWVRVLQSVGTPLPEIAWISPNSHSATSSGNAGYAAVNALTTDGKLWSWGDNNYDMLGGGGATINPSLMVGGLDPDDRIMAVETGGHTTMVIKKCSFKYGYMGHKTRGSMGDGTNDSGEVPNFNFDDTADVSLCGAPTAPLVNDIPVCNSGTELSLNLGHLSTPPQGMKVTWYTTNDQQTGTQVPNPEAVIVTLGDTFYAFYEPTDGSNCNNPPPSKVVTIIQKEVDCATDLSVTKTVDNEIPYIGDNVDFTITVSNASLNDGSNATGVEIADLLPSGYTYVSSTLSVGTYSETTGIWEIGILELNETATLTIKATVLATGDYNNTAAVTYTAIDLDEDPTNNTAEKTTAPVRKRTLLITNPHIYHKVKRN